MNCRSHRKPLAIPRKDFHEGLGDKPMSSETEKVFCGCRPDEETNLPFLIALKKWQAGWLRGRLD
jgi:hypothetical protein